MAPQIPQIGPPAGPSLVEQPGGASGAAFGAPGAALSELGQSVQGLSRVMQQQQAIADSQRVTTLATQHEYDLAALKAGIPASTDPTVALGRFNQGAAELSKKYLADPANASILDLLGPEINKNTAHYTMDAMVTAAKGAESMQVATAKAGLGPLANLVAGATDPVEIDRNLARAKSLIDPLRPEDRIALAAGFKKDVNVGRLRNMITANPESAVVLLHSPDFAKLYPDVTPEQKQQMLGQADVELRRPLTEADARLDASQGQLINSAMDKWNAGTFTEADAQQLADNGVPRDKVRQMLPGFVPVERSEPGAPDLMYQAIDAAPMSMSRFDILAMQGLSKQDQQLGIAYLTKKQGELRAPLGRAKALAVEQGVEALAPVSIADVNPAETQQRRQDVRHQLETIVSGTTDPNDVYRQVREFVAQEKGSGRLNKPGYIGPPPPTGLGTTSMAGGVPGMSVVGPESGGGTFAGSRTIPQPPPAPGAASSDILKPDEWDDFLNRIRSTENKPGEEWRGTPVSNKGAIGPYQITLPTANYYRIPVTDLYDEQKSRMWATVILNDLGRRFGWRKDLMAAGYNAGPDAVKKYGGVPPFAETRAYVAQVTRR
jgi:hypothetical protein